MPLDQNLPLPGPPAHIPPMPLQALSRVDRPRVARRLSIAAVALVCAGCASSQYPDIDEPMPPGWLPAQSAPPTTTGVTTAAPVTQEGTLQRADVERVVDAGLGRFLSHVAIEANLSAGRFTGWSIVGLQPAEAWRGIDLRPGDVVTRVNGMAIEREMEAFEAFQAVRQAPVLEVSYLRQGQQRTLRYTIIGPASLPPANPRQPVPG